MPGHKGMNPTMQTFQNIYLFDLNVVNYSGGRYTLQKGELWSSGGAITFAQSKLYYIFDGLCKIRIADKTYIGREGDVFLIPKHIPHSYESDATRTFGELWIHFDIFPNADLFELLHLPYELHFEREHHMKTLFERYDMSQKSNLISDRFIVKGILFEILAEYMKEGATAACEIKSESSLRMETVLRYIHEHVAENISVSKLAALVQMHPNHLIRFFKAHTGHTPANYIKGVRMDVAKRLLEESELNISEIAERVGMHEASYFSKIFKEYHSMSPKTYRAFFQNNPVTWIE